MYFNVVFLVTIFPLNYITDWEVINPKTDAQKSYFALGNNYNWKTPPVIHNWVFRPPSRRDVRACSMQ